MPNQETPLINEALLMEELGPNPSVAQVARFLRESTPTTWRRVRAGELLILKGIGKVRINLKSLADYLNSHTLN